MLRQLYTGVVATVVICVNLDILSTRYNVLTDITDSDFNTRYKVLTDITDSP